MISSFSDREAKVNYSSLCALYLSEGTNFCLFMLKYCTPKDAMLLNVLLVTHLLLCSNQMQGELRSVTWGALDGGHMTDRPLPEQPSLPPIAPPLRFNQYQVLIVRT